MEKRKERVIQKIERVEKEVTTDVIDNRIHRIYSSKGIEEICTIDKGRYTSFEDFILKGLCEENNYSENRNHYVEVKEFRKEKDSIKNDLLKRGPLFVPFCRIKRK